MHNLIGLLLQKITHWQCPAPLGIQPIVKIVHNIHNKNINNNRIILKI